MSSELSKQNCIRVRKDDAQVSQEQSIDLLKSIPDWSMIETDGEKRLQKIFKFKDFAASLAYTNIIGAVSEEQNHHPLIITEWGKVTVIWWTHVIRGLHFNDFIMAARSDELYKNLP